LIATPTLLQKGCTIQIKLEWFMRLTTDGTLGRRGDVRVVLSVTPLLLGLAMAAIGFNIEHDGAHQAFSNHAWVNRMMAMTMDLLGASSYVWHWKHDVVHHTYTNIAGHDADIELGIVGRASGELRRTRDGRTDALTWRGFAGSIAACEI